MNSELEQILISFYKDKMISFMFANPKYFPEAIDLAITNRQPYSWRSAWLLWSVMTVNDNRIQSRIKEIISNISTKEDGHQRELLKILLKMDLNDEQEGFLFNISLNIWEQINKKPSVRYTAFMMIIKIAKNHPDLFQEIEYFTQKQYTDSLSPGIKRSITKFIKDLKLSFEID